MAPDEKNDKPPQEPPLRTKPETPNEEPSAVATTALVDESGAAALRAESAFEGLYNGLDGLSEAPEAKILALLGFKKDYEVKRIDPIEYRFQPVEITVPKNMISAVKSILGKLNNIFPCNPSFSGAVGDDQVTLNFLIPGTSLNGNGEFASKAMDIKQICREADIKISSSPYVAHYIKGTGLMVYGTKYNAYKPDPSETKREDLNIAMATYSSLGVAQELKKEIPRSGVCTYLTMDFADFSYNDKVLKYASNLLSVYAGSKKFHVTFNNNQLVVINLAERAGDTLAGFAEEIQNNIEIYIQQQLREEGLRRNKVSKLKAYIGEGTIVHAPSGQFEIKDFPNHKENLDLRKLSAGLYIPTTLYSKKDKALKGRDGTYRITIVKSVEGREDLLEIIDSYRKTELTAGGPDIMIGYEAKKEETERYIYDPEIKMIVIEAPAGMGKSRLLQEIFKKLHDGVTLSVEASTEGTPFASLVNLTEQIGVKANLIAKTIEGEIPQLNNIRKFNSLPIDKKIKFVSSKPEIIEQVCLEALKFIKDNKGSLKLLIDDMHHIDEASNKFVVDLLRQVKAWEGSTVLISRRPEEVYKNREQEGLIDMEPSTQTVEVKGLNFKDLEITKKFILHSIPKNERQGAIGVKENKFVEEIANVATDSPMVMNNLMEAILSEENIFSVQDGQVVINRRPEIMERIIFSKDPGELFKQLENYYINKIESIPNKKLKELFFTINLLGGRVSKEEYAKLRTTLKVSSEDEPEQLFSRNFLLPINDEDTGRLIGYKVQHDTIIQSTKNIMDPNTKRQLSWKAYGSLYHKKEEVGNPTVALGLLHEIAVKMKFSKKEVEHFWSEYRKVVDSFCKDSENENAYLSSYLLGNKVINGEPSNMLQNTANLMAQEGKRYRIPEDAKNIIAESLFLIFDNGIMVGKWDDSAKAFDYLETIMKNYPNLILAERKVKIYWRKFELEYLRAEGAGDNKKAAQKMINILSSLEAISEVSPEEKVLAKIKIAYRDRDYKEVEKLALNNRRVLEELPIGDRIDVLRLAYCRVPFEGIRKRLEKGKNSDIIYQPEILEKIGQDPNGWDKEKLEVILVTLKKIKKMNEDAGSTLEDHQRLAILDMETQIYAFFGNYEEAEKIGLEYCHRCAQAEVGVEAVRAAHITGDIQVIAALRGEKVHRKYMLQKAYNTYNELGVKRASGIDKKHDRQAFIRIQKIRVAGLLLTEIAEEYVNLPKEAIGAKTQLKQEAQKIIDEADKEFKFINSHEKFKALAGGPELQYYLSNIGLAWEAGEKMQLEMESYDDLNQYPYLKRENRQAWLKWQDEIEPSENDLGASEDIRRGAQYIAQKMITI
jgi:hypothetical protein